MPRKKKTSRWWTAEEIRVLIEHIPSKGPQFCAELLGTMGHDRSRTAVGQMARKLDLYYQGPKLAVFRKGQEPPNKGKKMPRAMYKKCAPTMFKKGTCNGAANNNYKPVGSEVFRREGYWWVKLADDIWIQKHRLIWMENFGEIPEGHIVIFRDGNPHNFDLDNLELIQATTRHPMPVGRRTYGIPASIRPNGYEQPQAPRHPRCRNPRESRTHQTRNRPHITQS